MANKKRVPELPTLPFVTPRAFADWLARDHATSRGLWIKFAKAGSGVASITYAQALEAALRWGWIDGQSVVLLAGAVSIFARELMPRE
jgi:uncharacterized protein YdeI (YjbR/CyaY-like superfamily)